MKKHDSLAVEHPELLLEWDYDKNSKLGLDPYTVCASSGKKVWWRFPYDDPKTGKHFDFEWEAIIANRAKGVGCPYLSGRKVWPGFNDLATTDPEIAKEWHPTKNNGVSATEVASKSNKKAWWLFPYDDPRTGKHFDFEWEAVISTRARGLGCPFISNQKLWEGFNDLSTTNPELLSEWDYKKNEADGLMPNHIMAGAETKAWWICPACGKHYKARLASKKRGMGCPRCAEESKTSFPEQAICYYLGYTTAVINRYLVDGKIEVDIYLPEYRVGIEYDGAYYHSTKESKKKELLKDKSLKEKGIRLIRVKECKQPPDNKEKNCIYAVLDGHYASYSFLVPMLEQLRDKLFEIVGVYFDYDPNIQRDYSAIYGQYVKRRKESSLSVRYPEIAAEWHPTKNGDIEPSMVYAHSAKVVWWLCPKSHTYNMPIDKRTMRGFGCPYCSGHRVLPGFNDLGTKRPDLSKEWNYEMNGNTTPSEVTPNSNQRVWWICPTCGYNYQAKISNRSNGNGCPKCRYVKSGKSSREAAVKRVGSIVERRPDLAAEWNYEKNQGLTPDEFTEHSNKKVWWIKPYDDPETGKHFEFEWEDYIANRAKGIGCPYLSGRRAWPGFNDLTTTNPELAKEWHPTRNGAISAKDVTGGSGKKAWWMCSVCGNEWETVINYRTAGSGCPKCRRNKRRAVRGARRVVQLSLDGSYITTYNSIAEAKTATGAAKIGETCRGIRNHSGGYKWMYLSEWEDKQR